MHCFATLPAAVHVPFVCLLCAFCVCLCVPLVPVFCFASFCFASCGFVFLSLCLVAVGCGWCLDSPRSFANASDRRLFATVSKDWTHGQRRLLHLASDTEGESDAASGREGTGGRGAAFTNVTGRDVVRFGRGRNAARLLFTLRHFHGTVTYSMKGFVEGNRATAPMGVTQLLGNSTDALIARILGPLSPSWPSLSDGLPHRPASHRRRVVPPATPAQRLADAPLTEASRSQLAEVRRLVAVDPEPSVVYCIKPTRRPRVRRTTTASASASAPAPAPAPAPPPMIEDSFVAMQLHVMRVAPVVRQAKNAFHFVTRFDDFFERFLMAAPVAVRGALVEKHLANLQARDAEPVEPQPSEIRQQQRQQQQQQQQQRRHHQASRMLVLELLHVLEQQYPGILERHQRSLWKHAARITMKASESHHRRKGSVSVDNVSEELSATDAGVVVGQTHVYCYLDPFNALECVRRAVTNAMSRASVRLQVRWVGCVFGAPCFGPARWCVVRHASPHQHMGECETRL